MNKTGISWTDYTSNPLRYRDATGRDVWACVKLSSGCANCYASVLAQRYRRGADFNAYEMRQLTPYLDEPELRRLATSDKLRGAKVFVGDMTDLFGAWVPEALLRRLFALFSLRRDVTWQLLTKRPERLPVLLRLLWSGLWLSRPLPNVWIGTSVENAAVSHRIATLLDAPVAVPWVSFEPLLGPMELDLEGIAWAVIGGESGPGYRAMEPAWLSSLVVQCRRAGVAAFVKQDSGARSGQQGRLPEHLWATKEFPRLAVTA